MTDQQATRDISDRAEQFISGHIAANELSDQEKQELSHLGFNLHDSAGKRKAQYQQVGEDDDVMKISRTELKELIAQQVPAPAQQASFLSLPPSREIFPQAYRPEITQINPAFPLPNSTSENVRQALRLDKLPNDAVNFHSLRSTEHLLSVLFASASRDDEVHSFRHNIENLRLALNTLYANLLHAGTTVQELARVGVGYQLQPDDIPHVLLKLHLESDRLRSEISTLDAVADAWQASSKNPFAPPKLMINAKYFNQCTWAQAADPLIRSNNYHARDRIKHFQNKAEGTGDRGRGRGRGSGFRSQGSNLASQHQQSQGAHQISFSFPYIESTFSRIRHSPIFSIETLPNPLLPTFAIDSPQIESRMTRIPQDEPSSILSSPRHLYVVSSEAFSDPSSSLNGKISIPTLLDLSSVSHGPYHFATHSLPSHNACQQHIMSPIKKSMLIERSQLPENLSLESRPLNTISGRPLGLRPDPDGTWFSSDLNLGKFNVTHWQRSTTSSDLLEFDQIVVQGWAPFITHPAVLSACRSRRNHWSCWFDPVSQSSSETRMDKVDADICAKTQAGILEKFDPHTCGSLENFVSVVHSLKIVPKPGTSKIRPVVDFTASGLNAAMQSSPFHLPQVHGKQGWFAGLIHQEVILKMDVESAFYHIWIKPSCRHHFGIRDPITGHPLRFAGLPMGAAQSPRVCHGVMLSAIHRVQAELRDYARAFEDSADLAWMGALTRAADRISLYTDDIFTSFPPFVTSTVRTIVFDTLRNLGISLASDKIETGTSVKVLGLICDSLSLTLSLPKDKASKYASLVTHCHDAARKNAPLDSDHLASLIGYLEHTTKVFTWGRVFLNSLRKDSLNSQPNGAVLLSDQSIHDLEYWTSVFQDHFPFSYSCEQSHLLASNPAFVIVTDASFLGAGGKLKTFEGSILEYFQRPWYFTSQRDINLLEAQAIIDSILAFSPHIVGHTVNIYTDNTAAAKFLTKGSVSTRSNELLDALRALVDVVLLNRISLHIEHVPGSTIVDEGADYLSRQSTEKATNKDDYVKFGSLKSFCSPDRRPSIDACADTAGLNRQDCTMSYLHPQKPLEANWTLLSGKLFWANPPWNSLSHLLPHLFAAIFAQPYDTSGFVLLPDFPSTTWHRNYIARRHFLIRRIYRLGSQSKWLLKWNPYRKVWYRAKALPFDLLLIKLGHPDYF